MTTKASFGALLLLVSSASLAAGHPLDDLQPGHWYRVPDSSLKAALQGATPDVMKPWSGGVFDTHRNRLVIWGGGHGNYSGNELYAFDVEALEWQQLTRATPKASIRSDDVYLDGRPSSRHTYDGLVYLPPPLDTLWSSGGSIWQSGHCSGQTWVYDFLAQPPESGWTRASEGRAGCVSAAALDPVSGNIWYYNKKHGLSEFVPRPGGGTWQTRDPKPKPFKYMTATVDPRRRLFVLIGGGEAYAFDIRRPGRPKRIELNTTGDRAIESAKAPGLQYDPRADRIVAWSGEPDLGLSAADVYVLDLDARHWRRVRPAPGNPAVPGRAAGPKQRVNGTYGRFQYMPDHDAYILVNAVDRNVYFYRLPKP